MDTGQGTHRVKGACLERWQIHCLSDCGFSILQSHQWCAGNLVEYNNSSVCLVGREIPDYVGRHCVYLQEVPLCFPAWLIGVSAREDVQKYCNVHETVDSHLIHYGEGGEGGISWVYYVWIWSNPFWSFFNQIFLKRGLRCPQDWIVITILHRSRSSWTSRCTPWPRWHGGSLEGLVW